jgi:pimeloyl-ACP methyl ester carboxylesterase
VLRVAALLPRSRLVVVPGEPHAVHYTRPDLVGELVRELLLEEGEQTGRQLGDCT